MHRVGRRPEAAIVGGGRRAAASVREDRAGRRGCRELVEATSGVCSEVNRIKRKGVSERDGDGDFKRRRTVVVVLAVLSLLLRCWVEFLSPRSCSYSEMS